MRNAALTLGLIGGLIGLVVGFFSFGYTEAIDRFGEIDGLASQVGDVTMVRAASFLGPLLAIAGAAMSKTRALWGGVLMLVSAALMYHGFGFNVFTLFPIGFWIP